jgi:hypothetical protein
MGIIRVMTEQAEQLVLDYLRRVSDAAHGVLRSDHRVVFVGRLRGRIQEMCANAGATKATDVAKILDRFGDPTALVAREQSRLRGMERSDEAEDTIPAAVEEEPSTEPIPVVQPASERPVSETVAVEIESDATATASAAGERSNPAAGATSHQPAGAVTDQPAAAATGQRAGAALDRPLRAILGWTAKSVYRPPQGASDRTAGVARNETPGSAPDPMVVRSPTSDRRIPDPANSSRTTPGQRVTPQARPTHSGPPLYEPPTVRHIGAEVPAITSKLVGRLPPNARYRLSRSALLEGIGVALLGVGGLILPVPLWFLGALAVLPSLDWNRVEKAIGIAAAPGAVVLGALVHPSRQGGWGDPSAYMTVLQTQGMNLFRIGAAVGAGYLAWRMLTRIQPPRRRRPPWRRAYPPRR